jgi:uncharacterized protein YutE (UPF0331/DUF86 family)
MTDPDRPANAELFDAIGQAGWIPSELARALHNAALFRNVLVHGYAAVDVAVVRDVVENHLGDFDAFVAAVRARLG